MAGAHVVVIDGAIHATVAPDGRFVVRGLLPGGHELRVSAAGYVPRTVAVEAVNGRTTSVAIELALASFRLDDVEITAVADVAADAVVLSAEEIRASGARDLGGILRDVPGVTVTRSGGPGTPATASIRGSNPDQVLVLLDGVSLNSPLTGTADLSTVPLEGVERIVVLRGGQSVRYGAGALAGVVALESRRARGAELSARTGAGSWGERLAAITAGSTVGGGRVSRVSGLVSAEWRATEGDFAYAVPPVRGGGTASRTNADASTLAVTGNAAVERPAFDLSARVEAVDIERGMPGSIVQASPTGRQVQGRVAGIVTSAVRTGAVGWRVALDGQHQRAEFRDPSPPLGFAYDDTTRVDGVGGSVSAETAVGGVQVEAGIEARRFGVRSSSLAPDAPDAQHTEGAWSAAQLSLPLGSAATIHVAPGVRVDRHSLASGTFVSPRLSLALATSRFTARVAAGNAFSPPSLADQFFQEGVLVEPNPGLEPERVRGEIEGSVEVRQRLGAADVDWRIGAFRSHVDGMIVWLPDFRFVWRPENFDVRRRGWEAAVDARLPVAGLRVRSEVSHALVEYAGAALSGQVAYRPALTAGGRVSAAAGPVTAEFGARYVGERRTVPGSALNALEAYWMADARAGWHVGLGGWTAEVFVAAENLFDTDAAMLVDYPFPGRRWSVELRLRPFAANPIW